MKTLVMSFVSRGNRMKFISKKNWLCSTAIVASFFVGATAASAQTATNSAEETVVVKGFRASLNSALAVKKRSAAVVDSILSEDIAKFPDTNLAESMQRIPGVTLSRGDGGEGRNISVRGLGAGFTRVRINGMEGAAQTGSSDIYGAGNNGRTFDFNVFPSEIFSSLSTRKTTTADVEEGSLGATVDLRAPRPFDFRQDQVISLTAKGVYNSVSKTTDPRVSFLASKKSKDGKFGVLGTLSYVDRNIREVGYSAVDILAANSNALTVGANVFPFCTPLGYAITGPDPVAQAAKGATAANCSTNNPRTSTVAAYEAIANLRRADAPTSPGSGAFIPRIPRYVNSEQDSKRIGGSLTFQYRPSKDTDMSIDLLFSELDVERRDNYIAALSFARNVNANGQPMTSVKDVQFNSNGSLVYGLFDGVDIRSEGLVDQFTSTFSQVNFNFRHRFNDKFELTAFAGGNLSVWNGPKRLQTAIDIIDADNFSIDFRGGGTTPKLGFGVNVALPGNFTYAPGLADGTVTGIFSTQGKPSRNETAIHTFNLEGNYQVNDDLKIRAGLQNRLSDFTSFSLNLAPGQAATQALPAGVSLASITKQISGLHDLWGNGAPASWAAIDADKWSQVFNFSAMKYCGIECGAPSSSIVEDINSAYIMAEFNNSTLLPVPFRGDIGVRYVSTVQKAIGHIPVAAPVGALYPTVGLRNEVVREYDDTLPSMNVVFDLTPSLLARFSAAKVMTRAELGNLTPSSGVNPITRTGNINNPFLDPIRANAYDAALEWYFKRGQVVSVGVFKKDIKTYIQRVTTTAPFNTLGLPNDLLLGQATPTDNFVVGRFSNTPGGPLEGYELNLQTEFDYLPGPLKDVGLLANYTSITSDIKYILTTSSTGAVLTSVNNDLIGLSRTSASATLYYEKDKISARTTASYRDKFILGIPASPGSDIRGNDESLYVDASASYEWSDNLKFTLEAQNLTDEQNRLIIDSKRDDTLFETRIGRTITFGVTYKY